MRSQLSIEWLVETLDGPLSEDPDIIEVQHCQTYAQARRWADDIEVNVGVYAQIGLVRDRGNEADGLICRSWAYIEDGVLPEFFEDAYGNKVAVVPARYRREIAA